jgi:hypothetical protein
VFERLLGIAESDDSSKFSVVGEGYGLRPRVLDALTDPQSEDY